MELNDLKSTWRSAGDTSKSELDLQRMTKISNHPSLKKIRAKLLMEFICLTIFLIIYKDWFDGDKKPLYANVLLLSGLLLYILNDVIGYISILKPIRGTNLKISIQNYFIRIKRLFVCSLILSGVYGISLILFFTSVVNFNREKYFILTGIIATLLLMTYFSLRIWTNWIRSLKQKIKDFNLDG